jgi:hypothetical protein
MVFLLSLNSLLELEKALRLVTTPSVAIFLDIGNFPLSLFDIMCKISQKVDETYYLAKK